jgi:ribosomal protein S27E
MKNFDQCNHIYTVVGYDGEYVRLACMQCGNIIIEYTSL